MLAEAKNVIRPTHANREIVPRHDVDRVLLQLRKKDVEDPTSSKMMQWLQKDVFPGEKPGAIMDRAKELYKAAAHEQRENPRRGKLALENAERPLLFKKDIEGARSGENKSEQIKDQYQESIERGLKRSGFKGRVQIKNYDELPENVRQIVGKNDWGYLTPNGDMVINATRHGSIADALFTGFHEAFHRGELGSEAKPYLSALESARRNTVIDSIAQKLESKYGNTNLATREALAELNAAKRTNDWDQIKEKYGVDTTKLQRATALNTLQKFIEKAKDFFRNLIGRATGEKVAMSEHQVNELLDNIFGNVGKEIKNKPEDLMLSKGDDRLSNFKKSQLEQLKNRQIDRATYDRRMAAAEKKFQTQPEPIKPYVEPHPSLATPKQAAQSLNEVQNSVNKSTNKVKDAAKFVVDVRRMSALSGIMTLAKLGGAVAYRIVQSPLEMAVTSGLKRLPLIGDIAKGAARYGSGFDSGIEAKVLKDTFSKNTLDQMKKAFTTGKIDIDKYRRVSDAMLKDMDEEVAPTRPVMDFFVRTHKAIKTVAQMNEFSRSSRLRSQYEYAQYLSEGKTPEQARSLLNSEDVQTRIGMEAYADSQRAILMQDNKLHQKIEQALKAGEESDNPLANTASFAGKILMPVRKVPLNYAAESLEHIVGGAIVAKKILRAIRDGADALSPQEKDYVLRNLSRQTIGAALVAIGIAGAKSIGGYYQSPADYKQKDHPHPGDIKIGDTTVTHKVTHSPALELLQMAATYKHVADQRNARAGTLAAGVGLTKTLPFVDQWMRLSDAAKSQYQQDKYVDNLVKGLIVPVGVNDVAAMLDSARNPDVSGRKTTNLKEVLQSGVPIAREQLPAYKD